GRGHNMAATVSLELDPIFLKGLGYLHSKSKDSAEKLKALLDESLARGSDSTYRISQKACLHRCPSSPPRPGNGSDQGVSEQGHSEQTGFEILQLVIVGRREQQVQQLREKQERERKTASRKGNCPACGRSHLSWQILLKALPACTPPSLQVKVDLGEGADMPKKSRVEKQENRGSPVTVLTSRDLPIPDLSSFDETSADDFAMEMGLACVVCRCVSSQSDRVASEGGPYKYFAIAASSCPHRQMTVSSGNQLVECQECHNLYHQDCHKPQVTDKDVNDPRLVWYCARCTRQMKRMAQKSQKPAQKPAPSMVSAAPVAKDTLVRKSDAKPKQDTTSTFQAFKRAEVKASSAVSAVPSGGGSSVPPASGLTGWAAFGAKASPSGAKLGPSTSGSGGKGISSNQKPAGLSGLAGAKSGLGAKMAGNAGANNGSGVVLPLKPPPPLTLGKPGLNSSKVGSSGFSGVSGGSTMQTVKRMTAA
ncbi:integrator complex subunit 12-like, partial [Scleropages formosus]